MFLSNDSYLKLLFVHFYSRIDTVTLHQLYFVSYLFALSRPEKLVVTL